MCSYLNPCIVQVGGWGHPHEWISFCGDTGARRGWQAAGSGRAALPRVGTAAGRGASSAGSRGSAERSEARRKAAVCPGAAARRGGDTGTLPVVPQLPQKEPAGTSGNKTESAGGTSHKERLSASVNRFFPPRTTPGKG